MRCYSGKKEKKPVRFLNDNISNEISSKLVSLKAFFLKEFSHFPRSLEQLKHWKATEFRSCLLCPGTIVQKGRLKNHTTKHFIILHCAIRLLLSDDTYIAYNNAISSDLLKKCVIDYSFLYGEDWRVYNI
jgi:hypothetical protein